jgi:hypothetical protein
VWQTLDISEDSDEDDDEGDVYSYDSDDRGAFATNTVLVVEALMMAHKRIVLVCIS